MSIERKLLSVMSAVLTASLVACSTGNDTSDQSSAEGKIGSVSQAQAIPRLLADDVVAPDPAVNRRPTTPSLTAVGTRRIAIIMVHFGTPDGATPQDVYNTAFVNQDSLRAHYAENSFDTLNLEGDVFGWYQVDPVIGCDVGQISLLARQAATDDGVDLEEYDHWFFYYPAISDCWFGGLGELGSPANPARQTWYNGWFGTYVFVHELGHNLGFWHARSYGCGTSPLQEPGECSILDEYGDPFDPMGRGTAHFSAYHKGSQGWLSGCDIVTAGRDGVFEVEPIELNNAGSEAVRIPMDPSLCPGWLSDCYYYLEHRQPIGVFDGGPEYVNSPMHEGLSLRAAADIDLTQQFTAQFTGLLDMTRAGEHPYYDFFNSRLAVGDVFEDPSGLRIAVQSSDDGVARVAVHYPGDGNPPVCLDGTPFAEDPLCTNGTQDYEETDVDCGGPCVPCEPGDGCTVAIDCWSRICENNVCQPKPASCDDGIQNGTETDIDCGGDTCSACPDGKSCEANSDCQSDRCADGVCVSSQIDATLRVLSDWQTGFCGDVTLVNTGNSLVRNWTLQIRFADSYFTNTWNAFFSPIGDDVYEVTPLEWNNVIWPQSTTNIGFCANKTGSSYFPELLFVTSE